MGVEDRSSELLADPRLLIEGYGIATCEEIVAVTAEGCTYLSRPQRELYLVR